MLEGGHTVQYSETEEGIGRFLGSLVILYMYYSNAVLVVSVESNYYSN